MVATGYIRSQILRINLEKITLKISWTFQQFISSKMTEFLFEYVYICLGNFQYPEQLSQLPVTTKKWTSNISTIQKE